jgi:GNAT superfamily N-acetyltransferase
MFADTALAARIDRAEARMCASIARHVAETRPDVETQVRPISGGLAVYVSPKSPVNKVIGLALDEELDLDALAQIEAEWQSRNEPVRIEMSILVDPSIGGALTARGYRLHGFENVLGLAVEGGDPEPPATNIAVELVERDGLQRWMDIAIDAFMNLDGTGSVPDDAMPREQMAQVLDEVMLAPGFIHYLARLDGEAVGEAAMRIDGDLAQIAGAGTLPHARGRGVQKALLQRRLADARRAGCTLAVVTTAPGTRSQDNVMRRGFTLLYARAILIRALK